jgi:hypothetical protein
MSHPPHPHENVEELKGKSSARKSMKWYYCSECEREFEGKLNDEGTAYLEKGHDIGELF